MECARKAQELLRRRLLGHEDCNGGVLERHRKALSTVRDLLERTVISGEGNSLLIVGSQGCGKTWVVQQALNSLESNVKCRNNFIKVELNVAESCSNVKNELVKMHFHFANDQRLSELSNIPEWDKVLQELDKVIKSFFLSVTNKTAGMKDYSIMPINLTFGSLVHTDDRLALLEIAKRLHGDPQQGEKLSLSFAASLNYLLEALRSGNHSNQSVVFVLDHFDLFTHHKNQTLLYNLFDAAQTAHTPIAVIGLTCRLDVVELLEKRVKSRFSHRQINLFCDYSFEDYVRIFKSFLALPVNFSDREYHQQWEKQIEALSMNAKVREALRRQYNTHPDIGSLKSFLTLPVCRLGLRGSFLQPSDFSDAIFIQRHEPKAAMLHGVSVLELCLVIAMKHIVEINDGEPFNFEMVYKEYKSFTQRSHSVEFFSKPVALKAFEHLMSLEFVCPIDSGGSGKIQKEYQLMVLMLEEEQIAQAIQHYSGCPTDVARWGTSKAIA